ncbi:MAG: hypothetical protein LAN62_08740 [Acidobacteriia bacterium]|nr:hypothetical protein [Terriglobia bacterium]
MPINEYYDFAANTIQIERAKHFHELLGNYSRWGFHHPGPAFFYVLASGEAVLHDWLQVVPAVMNAQLVTILILNSIFLFITIAIFAKQCRSRLFLPAGVALSIYFVYVVNHTVAGSAIVAVWMPYVPLFCFVLFATACPSVASGNIKQLPILTFTGLMLLHGHIAQPLFVCPLAALALSAVLLSQGRQMGLRHFIRVNRTLFLISIVLVLVFATPILLDVMLNNPNNIHNILVHMSGYHGMQKGWGQSLKYEISFFTFLPNPDVVLQSASAQLISRGGSNPYVVVYWCFCCFLAGLTTGNLISRRRPVPAFLKYLMAEVVIIGLLFFFWSRQISGPLYNFNGHFFYSVQLLILLGMGCLILNGVAPTLKWMSIIALSCALPSLMLIAKPYFRNAETGWERTDRLIASLPPDMGLVHVTFPTEDWLEIIGVASHMKREGHPFCITDDYWSLFGHENVCDDHMIGLQNLILAPAPRRCEAPCRTLEHDEQFVLLLSPYPWFKPPFQIEGDGVSSLNKDFYREEEGMWSSKSSTIHFLLAPEAEKGLPVRVRIIGEGLPGRPVEISLNGRHIGIISAGQHISEFVVDGNSFRPGRENGLMFKVENAGPVGRDWRVLGFFVKKVEFEVFNCRGPSRELQNCR